MALTTADPVAPPEAPARAGRRRPGALGLTVGFTVAAALAGLAIGPSDINPWLIVRDAASHLPLLGIHAPLSATDSAIVWQIRAPRVVLGLLVGATLAGAGSGYQGTLRNPLADPYLLGVAAGAGLGATIGFVTLGNQAGNEPDLIPAFAFTGAVLAVAVTYGVGSGGANRGMASLLLAGVAVATLLTAAQTFLQQQHLENELTQVYVWLLGSFVTASWHDVALAAPYVAVCAVVLLASSRQLDVLAVGDVEAASLGVAVAPLRLTVIAAASLGTAGVVAVSGLIGFVGIIVPHTVRLLVGTSYRRIVPLSLIGGAGFLVVADIVARSVLAPSELPIGVVTAAVGAPFFIFVLRTRRLDTS